VEAKKIVYFDHPGKQNTDDTLRLARERADELRIRTVVIASVKGRTAVKAMDVFDGFNIVIVAAHTGWSKADHQWFEDEARQKVISRGGNILIAPHVFGGLSYAVRHYFETAMLGVDMGCTLRLLGEGMKVVCEIAMAAADAGMLAIDEEVISIGGTNRGVDTAVTLVPVNVYNFFNIRVKEIICKPRL